MVHKKASKAATGVFCALLAAPLAWAVGTVDYADSPYRDEWLRHPVYGAPSSDAFVHDPKNPVMRGTAPYEWPVNGFLFQDPQSIARYIYVGDYGRNYGTPPSRCLLYCSMNHGQTWKDLGVVLQGDKDTFDQGGSTPDVSVVYDQGRYHMIYDWAEPGGKGLGGLAYAWADQPEGPFRRAPEPITRNQNLPLMLDRYRRTYAATLIHRQNDWLILGMMDSPPNSWCYFGMTAAKPEGPYSERVILRNVETEYYHPPLLEFYPAFVYRGFIYAPATSVALNRNFNVIYRAPLEKALKPGAWEIWQHGSAWHSEDVENETYGLWGQTFSGMVTPAGQLEAMFPSRDKNGMGTINLASRSMIDQAKEEGFVLTGHLGPSLTLLGQAYNSGHLKARLQVRGTARMILDYRGALGPNVPEADATLHPISLSHYDAVELTATEWRVMRVEGKTNQIMATGKGGDHWNLDFEFDQQGKIKLMANGRLIQQGDLGVKTNGWTFGLVAEPATHVSVEDFTITGNPRPAHFNYLPSEALLGAGERKENWEENHGPEFRFGVGVVAKAEKARVKWNVPGERFILWSPKGPHFGRVQVRLDGRVVAGIDLRAAQPEPSQPVWTSQVEGKNFHAITLTATEGKLVVDSLDAEQ